MAPYIHSVRDGVHIIDLTKTVECLESALGFIEGVVGSGKQILLVGNKKQAQEIVKQAAVDTGMPFVVKRWLGGMLTNFNTMNERIKHLKDTEFKMSSGELAAKYSKLEVQRFQEEIDHMNEIYGGIKDLNGRPGAVFITDVIQDATAVREAKKLAIPIIAIVDSNVDPSQINYPIPANDDSIKTIKLIVGFVEEAIKNGKATRLKTQPVELETTVKK